MKIPTDTLILIADGEKALFLRNKGDADYPNLVVERKETHENPPTGEQGTDRPGRMMDDVGHHTAMQETDWHRLEKERFAAELADRLFRMAGKKNFHSLIVAAPPRALGELHKRLHKTVSDRIIGEIHKDLTRLAVFEIETYLKKAA